MKKKYMLILVSVLCCIMASCNSAPTDTVIPTVSEFVDDTSKADSVNADNSVNPIDSVNPEDEVGLVYADPIIDMFILIDGQGWAHIKSEDKSQVYFYLKDDKTGNNVISISSQYLAGEADDKISEIWDSIKRSLNAENSDPVNIKAGQYKGVSYEYNLDFNGETLECRYIFWSTDETIYICTVSADSNSKEIIDSAIDSIMVSFETVNDKE